jgi:hypothetical protein
MENKYYIPSIEEFHVGFEYERVSYGGKLLPGSPIIKEWHKEILSDDAFDWNDVTDVYNEGKQCTDIRVKCLDQSDIESLGFLQHSESKYHYFKGGERTYKDYIYEISHREDSHFTQVIANTNPKFSRLLFEGTIKNISELKVLLKQLGIDDTRN